MEKNCTAHAKYLNSVKMSSPSGKARSGKKRKRAHVFYGNLKGQKLSLGLPAATPATTGVLGVESSSTSGTSVWASGSCRSCKKIGLFRSTQVVPSSASEAVPSSASQKVQAGPSSASLRWFVIVTPQLIEV